MHQLPSNTMHPKCSHPKISLPITRMATNVTELLIFLFFISVSPVASQAIPAFTSSQGEWQLLQASIGISAMHMQLLHHNQVIMFDRTDFGLSNVSLPGGLCRFDPYDTALETDCTAHSILYDVADNSFRPLMVQTDTWCSSGAVLPDGTLVQTGGFNDGDRVVRKFTPCLGEYCDWTEFPKNLSERRWYATDQILPDGRIIIVGGRRQFNYEFYPNTIPPRTFNLAFLYETEDGNDENNLYPFLHLLPDGNLFIFANTRSILLDYNQNHVIREFPRIPGDDPRNYPSTGSSVLLPLEDSQDRIEAEILLCGGAPRSSFRQAKYGNFISAISTCGRLRVTDQSPTWTVETMPIARVMGDMLLLPTGDVIMINGAQQGTAGWEYGREPVTRPVIYRPFMQRNWRFSVMAPSARPRMYHSSAILLADGRVLVGGSNPHALYNFSGVEFPTDLSLEAFSPPYLSTEHAAVRPTILSVNDRTIEYGETFSVRFNVVEYLTNEVLSVRIIPPSFTTHSFAMNQRMVVLRIDDVGCNDMDTYTVNVVGPSRPEIAPPGYYMLFLVHAGVPSSGTWVKIQH